MNTPAEVPVPDRRIPLSSIISRVIQGGAAFSYQLHKDPASLPVRDVIRRALDLGVRTFDTSPYYDPSEILLGEAFSHTDISSQYTRGDYILMTKVGRITASHFDYSSDWVRYSVRQSLERFKTSYLDVVFCHDIEYVTDEDAITAIGVLWEFVATGQIRYVGISGYPIDKLVRIARLARERYGRPLDVVQNWAQLTLQNTRLKEEGLIPLRDAGVDCVCSSSPLAIGLLRSQGVPQGTLGDFHPAPPGLRAAAQRAADWIRDQGDSLASLALRFVFSEALAKDIPPFISIIFGAGTVEEVEENVAASSVLEPLPQLYGDFRKPAKINRTRVEKDRQLVEEVRRLLGDWIDYTFTSPEEGWDIQTKRMETPPAKARL